MSLLLSLLLGFSFSASAAAPAAIMAAGEVKCDDAGQVYRVCSDQAVAYQSAEEGAQAKKKLLIVEIGAQWCPWCLSLHKILKDPANEKQLAKDFAVFELGLYQDREKSASGQAVLEKLMGYAGEKKEPKGIPILVVVDPVKRVARFIDTEALEKNTATTKGHDVGKVLKSIRVAANSLHQEKKPKQ